VDIDTLGTLKHINIRKEGKSEKILAVDLKLVAEISADALIEFHPTLRSWLWDPDGNPRFNTLIDSIDLLGTLNDHAVKVNDITVSECALRKWKIEALPKNMVNVAFVASFKPPAPGVVARLADLVSERVSLVCWNRSAGLRLPVRYFFCRLRPPHSMLAASRPARIAVAADADVSAVSRLL
jgi:hypothetical protein